MDMDFGSLAFLLVVVGFWAVLCGVFFRVDSGGRGRRFCYFFLNRYGDCFFEFKYG